MQSPILDPLKPPPPSQRHRVVLVETPPAPPKPEPPRTPRGALGAGSIPLSRAIERRTLRNGMLGALFEGLFAGMCSMNTYVAIKAMGAGFERWEEAISTLMQMLPSILMAFALVYSVGGRVRKRRPYWLFVAVFGRLIVLTVALFVNPFLFVALVAWQSIAGAGLAPALNHIWGANCTPRARGRVFTWYSVTAQVATVTGALIAGAMLDGLHVQIFGVTLKTNGDARNYAVLYPVAGVIGLTGMLWFWRIRLRFTPARDEDDVRPRLRDRIQRAIGQARSLLARDRDFRLYEFGFFLYGTAFMMIAAVIPLFFKNRLDASYKDFSLATVVLVQAMHLVAAPFIARFASGRRVTVVTRVAFAMLVLYPVLLGATDVLASHSREAAIPMIYAAFGLFGAAMAVVHFVWNLGPVAFARGGNPLPYTSTHAALVGLRASIGFPIAYVLMRAFPENPLPIFGLASLLFGASVVVMTVLDRRLKAASAHSRSYSMTG